MLRPEGLIFHGLMQALFASVGVRVVLVMPHGETELNGVRAVIQTPSNEKESHKFIAIALERFLREARVELK